MGWVLFISIAMNLVLVVWLTLKSWGCEYYKTRNQGLREHASDYNQIKLNHERLRNAIQKALRDY